MDLSTLVAGGGDLMGMKTDYMHSTGKFLMSTRRLFYFLKLSLGLKLVS